MIVDLVGLVDRVGPILVFLVAITIVAEICDACGLFDVAAHRAAQAARGRVAVLWLLVVGLAVVSTVLLSLDTTAVLLTPVAISVARKVNAAPIPFALTTLWLANTASLLLPVSNLTNLLARHPFDAVGVGTRDYIALVWPPALVLVAGTVLVIWLLHRRELRGRYAAPPQAASHDRPLLLVCALVCLAMAGGFVSGISPVYPAVAAAVVLLVATGLRAPELLRRLRLPWRTVIALCVLFLVVDAALRLGLEGLLRGLVGSGGSAADLLRVSGVGAVSANVVDNLPAYLALEPTVADSPARLAALLVGVNAGPLVTLWGSVATILWLHRCRAAGLRVDVRRLALSGLLCAVVVVPLATVTLAVTS